MKYSLLLITLLFCTLLSAQDRVIITGLLDGTLSGATPRAVELYIDGTVDLSGYTIQRYANGGTEPTDITLTGTYTDAFVYVVNGQSEFEAAFGTAGDFANIISSGSVSGNGNDAFALATGGTVVDVVGGPIGGPDANIYQDSYLYRKAGTLPSGSWNEADWNLPGNDVLDGLEAEAIGATVPFGTYLIGEVGPTISIEGDPIYEGEVDIIGGFTVILSEPATTELTLAYELYGTATEGMDYTLVNTSDTLRLASGETQMRVGFMPIDDELIEGTETIGLRLTYLSDSTYSAGPGVTLDLLDNDLGTDPIGIHIVQGSGFTSPLLGNVVTVEAVVTGDFTDGLDGFFVQEENEDADADPLTSEGIFVFAPDAEVMVGDLVTVTGEVEEYFGQTQLDGASAGSTIVVNGNGVGVPAATVLSLPKPDSLLESLEGMLVQPQDLVITSLNNLDRFGEVEATSEERLVQFTECNEPDPAALTAYLDSLESDAIIVDDARSGTNPEPILLPDGSVLAANNSLRAGQTINGLTGVLGYSFNRYRIQPTDRTGVTFTGNERPTSAPHPSGELRVVSANVLNYFTTLGSRGADTEAELVRQEAKIVAALTEMDADIIGLIEIENNDNVALQRLVDSLNVVSSRGYTYVDSPNAGDDEIMVALLYDTLRIEETGTAAALSTPESLFSGARTNRVPLAQTFRITEGGSTEPGASITVCVNHFKSKGSDCGEGDDDDGGAGNCNGTRAAAAAAIAEWLATKPTGRENDNVLIIGDLNSYRMEDPIDVLLDAGYVNTKTLNNANFPCAGGPPSYSFGGYWGSLDYALASDSLAPYVTFATAWTVNAPEPEILDYNQEGIGDQLYAKDFYRFSDHDPIIVDLSFNDIIDGTSTPGQDRAAVGLIRLDETTYSFSGEVEKGSFLLTDSAGKPLTSGNFSRNGQPRIDVDRLPGGLYFLVYNSPINGVAAFRVVVP